jgi:flagellar biosynthetic protein FliQ
MTPETVIALGRQAVEIALMLSGPLLLSALGIGLLISIFQAATQINEATLSFIPKLVGTFLVLILAGPWMLQLFVDYFRQLYERIPSLIG